MKNAENIILIPVYYISCFAEEQKNNLINAIFII